MQYSFAPLAERPQQYQAQAILEDPGVMNSEDPPSERAIAYVLDGRPEWITFIENPTE